MPRGSSPKRERQYKHIESSAKERGASSGRAKEIAARTVNKQRAQSGETKGSAGNSGSGSGNSSGSKTKSDDSKRSTSRSTSSSGRSSGSRSSSGSSASSASSGSSSSSRSSGSSSNSTFRELYAEAQRRDIKGRSSMDKAQLERALAGSGGKRSR